MEHTGNCKGRVLHRSVVGFSTCEREFCIEVLDKSAAEERWRRVLDLSVARECCRLHKGRKNVLEKAVAEKCWERMSWGSVGEDCWREVLEKNVGISRQMLEKRLVEKW